MLRTTERNKLQIVLMTEVKGENRGVITTMFLPTRPYYFVCTLQYERDHLASVRVLMR